MSATSQSTGRPSDACGRPDCEETFPRGSAVKGAFCSRNCWLRKKGQDALRQIGSQHTFCSTCYRRIKDLERPPEDLHRLVDDSNNRLTSRVADCIDGYQYGTEHAVDGIDDFADEDAPTGHRLERTRLSCECGAVDPGDQHDVLQQLDPAATATALWNALVELETIGALTHRPNRHQFLAALEAEGYAWAYIAGRALYA